MQDERFDDATVAAVFWRAMEFDLLPLKAVVAWADFQILNRDAVPEWIIDLSLAELASPQTVEGLLKPIAVGGDCEVVFGSLVALCRTPSPVELEDGLRFANRLFNMAISILNAGWADRRIHYLDWAIEELWLIREGIAQGSPEDTLGKISAARIEFRKPQFLDRIFEGVGWRHF